MSSSSYDINYYISKGYSIIDAENKVIDNKQKTSLGIKLRLAEKRLNKYNSNLSPNELLNWEEKLSSFSNLGSSLTNIYKIVNNILKETSDLLLEDIFTKIYDVSIKNPNVPKILNKTETIKELYGENSIHYVDRLNINKKRATCSFEKFSENYIDKNQAQIDFNIKYGSNNIEHIIKKHNVTKEEALVILNEKTTKGRNTFLSKSIEEQQLINSSKALTLNNYIKKYGDEIGQIKYDAYLKNIKGRNSLNYYIEKYGEILGTEKYNARYERKNIYCCLEYWLNKGYDEKQAIEKLNDIFKNRTNFSLEYCKEKYGDDKGLLVWKERQQLWQTTLNNKSQEEINNINKKKSLSLENFINKYGEIDGNIRYENYLKNRNIQYSKLSCVFFTKLYKKLRKLNIIERTDVYFGITGGKEYFIKDKHNTRFYDFCIPKLNIIIEFQGIAFHPKPNDITWKSAYGLSYEEVYSNDKLKEQMANNRGFNILYVWEDENLEQKINELIILISSIHKKLYQ